MAQKRPLKTSLRSSLGSGLAMLVLLAIAAYAMVGPTGVLAWGEYQKQLQERQKELALLESREDALANRIRLLEPGNADPDLASELIRKELNVVHPDEIIIPLK